MDDFHVFVETRSPDGQRISRPEDLVDALMDAVTPYHGLCSVGTDGWDAWVSLDAEDAVEAGAVGAQLVRSLAAKAGMPAWPIVRVDAMRDDVLDEENSRPTMPDLVSVPEAAEILGVSPQRVHQLTVERADFPTPAYELRAGKLWLKASIEAFNDRWERKPGRPRKTA